MTEESPWLRHGRALFVVFHLVAVLTVAVPSVGGGMNRSAWKAETVQNEFRVWTARLGRFGLNTTVQELEESLWHFALHYEHGRRRVLAPLIPYLRYTGSAQSWRMFVAPHRYPGRLEIEVDRGDGFTPVYRGRSAEFTWGRHWFDHDRMRSAVFRYAWKHFRHPRGEFSTWVAAQAVDDFPDAHRIRVSFLRYRTLSPAEAREGQIPPTKRELVNIRSLVAIRRKRREGR